MKAFPPLPPVDDASADLLASGHLWLQEYVDGLPLRFSLEPSGLVVLGDRASVYRTESMPLPYAHAARHVRERLDRDALREAVADVAGVTFFGVATTHRVLAYDWERLPPFLGTAVWSDEKGRVLPPDAVEKIFERLGLDPVNALAKEVRAVDFHPDRYEVPASAWYDGPAAGVVLRSKTGGAATLLRPDFAAAAPEPAPGTASEAAAEYVTAARVDAAVDAVEARGEHPTTDAVIERVLEAVVREHHGRLAHDDTAFDLDALRSAVAAAVQRTLGRR